MLRVLMLCYKNKDISDTVGCLGLFVFALLSFVQVFCFVDSIDWFSCVVIVFDTKHGGSIVF